MAQMWWSSSDGGRSEVVVQLQEFRWSRASQPFTGCRDCPCAPLWTPAWTSRFFVVFLWPSAKRSRSQAVSFKRAQNAIVIYQYTHTHMRQHGARSQRATPRAWPRARLSLPDDLLRNFPPRSQ